MKIYAAPELYEGRVGHDVSEEHCSCGGYHYASDEIVVGTKTVLGSVDGELKTVEWGAALTEFESKQK